MKSDHDGTGKPAITAMKTIAQVRIGDTVDGGRNGKGMVTGRTARTVTVTFENGNEVRNTYKHKDAIFLDSDF